MTNLVFFPGLGLEFTLNRIAFHLLGRPIYWYGVIIGCGFLLAVLLCSRWAPEFGLTEDHVTDSLIYVVPMGIVGVRAYYVIFNLDLYRRADGSLDWAAIFRLSDGGLAIYGALIAAILTLIVYCRVRNISFPAFGDLVVQGLLLGQSIGRWGNFMNVEAYSGKAGIKCEIFVPEGTSPGKIDMIRAHGATCTVVPGSRDHCADV